VSISTGGVICGVDVLMRSGAFFVERNFIPLLAGPVRKKVTHQRNKFRSTKNARQFVTGHG
jgi:hypothetical protein